MYGSKVSNVVGSSVREQQTKVQPPSAKGRSPTYSIFNPRESLAGGGLATVTPPFAAWMSSGETPVLVPLLAVAPPVTVVFPVRIVPLLTAAAAASPVL